MTGILRRVAALSCMVLALVLLVPAFLEAAATTDVINMFKYTYGAERMLYLFAVEVVLARILQRRKTPVGGRGQWILPVQTRNTGVYIGNTEGGAKTTRRAQPATAEATFSLQEFHYIWDISWKMLQDARKDEFSFARAIDFMDESMKRRLFRLINADYNGQGRGELGILPAADNQATVTVRALPFTDLGMIVDLVDDSDDATLLGVDAQAVTAINVPTREITTGSAAAGTAAGDYFTVADSVGGGASLHTFGILNWASDSNPKTVVGNLGGIDRSVAGNEYWEATVLSNGGTLRPLTEDLILTGMDTCRERGGVVISDFVSNLAIIRRYHESLRADTFFALQAVKEFGSKVGVGRDAEAMKSGEETEGETIYHFSGVPWRAEMFFDANRLLGLNREHIYIGHGENEVPRPLSEIFGEDMITFFTPTANTTFDVVGYWQNEMLCDAPTALTLYSDLAES